ncbi:tRNA (cytidine(34)-2'-O)-methyltransferase [Rhizobiales bacterium L72]|uniref:tRNA (cytidine(34)-2'-O)-methyltransferase n=1 Tax=Propylenella binzhouense TaxID=2555902 RepID=A0A964T1J6_9HYPH|nr:tRNA (cytidine(34)-2'-O)-methyltransferase [Propylenella binzhouense]
MECALFEPDIPQNAGSVIRLGACFGVRVHLVHPCGFALTDRHFRRAGMDYLDRAALREHVAWEAFDAWRRAERRRLVALSTHGRVALHDYAFRAGDVLLLGRESAGLPEPIRGESDAVLRIPVGSGNRSLNVAVAAGIALAEALRQVGGRIGA